MHISCHGSASALHTTLDKISFKEVASILNPHIDNKRLFLSACSSVNENLADQILLSTDCYSIIGPSSDIYFNDAAIFWASFYHLMFKYDSMKRSVLLKSIKQTAKLFQIEINYFSKSRRTGYRAENY